MNIINKIFRSKSTILDMLELRGYNIEKYKNFSLNEIDVMYKAMDKKITTESSPLDFDCVKNENSCYIKFVLFTKLRVANAKTIIENMIDEYVKEGDTIIFVVKDKINNIESFDSVLSSYLTEKNIMVQIFWIDTLLINITKHELVPAMRILNEEEKQDIFEKANISNFTQLPLILKTDPVAKFYGLIRGDLVEIIRPSPTGGVYKNYRYCQ
jgi:DNA-directed RNA polymerases I, II, and III subunit RPABC1